MIFSPHTERQSAFPIALQCPDCRSPLLHADDAARCPQCSRRVPFIGGAIPDFVGGDTSPGSAVFQIPSETLREMPQQSGSNGLSGEAFIRRAGEWVLHVTRQYPVLGPFAEELRYNLRERSSQPQNQELSQFFSAAAVGRESRVLDVGSGAGQSLRLLTERQPVRVGVDLSAIAAALGRRLAQLEGQDVAFVRCTGCALPFADATFTHVISRGAINYMHQRGSVDEMGRVLRSGGWLFLRVERFCHDLNKIRIATSTSDRLARMRDLGLGIIHEITGLQPVPGRRLTGGRTFCTLRRLRRLLGRVGFEICDIRSSTNCPKLLGVETQMTIWARKS